MKMNHWVAVYALSDGCRLVVVEVTVNVPYKWQLQWRRMYRISGSFSGGSCTEVVAASVAAPVERQSLSDALATP